MDVRPNSHPEKPGRAMTGTLSDGTVMDAAFVDGILGRDTRSEVDGVLGRGVGPDMGRDSSTDRLITKRTQRLTDARENLKDRLHSYIELRSVLKWRPPANMAYLTFAARLKSSVTWPWRTDLPTPGSLAEAGFYYKGLCTLFYINFNTSFSRLLGITIYTLFSYHRPFRWGFVLSLRYCPKGLADLWHCFRRTCSLGACVRSPELC